MSAWRTGIVGLSEREKPLFPDVSPTHWKSVVMIAGHTEDSRELRSACSRWC